MRDSRPGRIPAHDLLIAGMFELGEPGRAATVSNRMGKALLLGKAGDVRAGPVDGGFMAARARRQVVGARPRIRHAHWSPDKDGSYTMLAGTIHHRSETCRRLAIDPGDHPAEDYSAIHAKYGEDCDRLIAGDYVAVTWYPAERRLRIARSPLSRYPVHTWRDEDFLVVSSLPRALFAAGAPDEIDTGMVGDRLLLNQSDHTRSFYRDHRRVPAATVEHHDRRGVRRRTYFDIRDVPDVRFKSDDDYVEALHEEMGRAHDAVFEDTSRAAILLSGGLDSQAVSSYAIERLPPGEQLHGYTSVPIATAPLRKEPGRFADESGHVRALAEMYPDRLITTFLACEDLRFGETLEAGILLSSWPTISEGAGGWAEEALAAAEAAGCDTMLDGGFGNATFSYDGRTGYPTWLREGRLVALMRELALLDDGRSMVWRFATRAVMPNLPQTLQAALKRLIHSGDDPLGSWSPARRDFVETSGALDRYREEGLDGVSYRDARSGDFRRFIWEVAMTDAPELLVGCPLMYGVQQRDPLMYQPLVELCAGMPDDQYLRDGEDRWLARRLLRGRVPEIVRTEQRRGRQNADWATRFARERDDMLAEIAKLERDETIASVIDLPRLRQSLREWEGAQDASPDSNVRIKSAVGIGLTTARFLRYAQKRNVG